VIFPAHADTKLLALQLRYALIILACRSFFHIEPPFAR
jgi:hypothetical protein